MNLTKPDISRLYGRLFFKIEKETLASLETQTKFEKTPDSPAPKPEPPKLNSGAKIQWKMRPTSKIALVLRAEEFAAPNLTTILKECVQSSGLQSAIIGFGILPDQSPPWDFTDMPVDLAVVFESEHNFPPIANLNEKNIYFTDKLLDLNSESSKQQLIALLKSI